MSSGNRLRIILIIYGLEYGGAERFLLTLIDNLSKEDYDISLVVCNKAGSLLRYVGNDVRIFDLNTKVSFFEFFEAALRIFRVVKEHKPRLVMSICDWANLATSFSRLLFGWRSPLILHEATILFQYYLLKATGHTLIKKFLVKFLYPKADLIVVPSEGAKRDLQQNFHIESSKIGVISYPVDVEKIRKLSAEEVSHPWLMDKRIPVIISVGRLVKLKNFSWLIEIFSILKRQEEVRLLIVGDGPERERLENLAKRLKVDRDIQFLGAQDNPFKFVAKSDIFVLPSLLESFSYVLVEAMACGVPVVSVDCPCGPGEIVQDGVSGFLVPPGDKEEMVRKLLIVLRDEELRQRFVRDGILALERFRVDKAIQEHGMVFKQISG